MANDAADNKRISSLDGLKAIMMLMIFCWHTPPNPASPIGEPAADLGARACEVLFVASGFLVGCRHYDRLIPAGLRQSWDYVSGKIAKIWPAHFIAFLVIAVYLAGSDPHDFFRLSTAWKAVVNLCLMQAWSADPFSFNSVAWFISALMFCWFMSPLLMSVLKRPRSVTAAAFAGCAVLRIALELASENGAFVFSVDFHVSPVIRCMEFFMGMLMAPAYMAVKKAVECRTCGGSSARPAGTAAGMTVAELTVAELIVSSCYIFLMYRMEGIWIRGYFVLAACVLVFTFALNAGVLSRFLSLKLFALFAVIQMEFYLFHQVIIRVLGPVMTVVSRSVFIQSVILFFITVAASVLYDRLLKDKFTALALDALTGSRKTDGE